MLERDDFDLLAEYAGNGSEPAFTALTERYIRLVYAAALRQVSDPHLAEEVAQVVFILLARKARSFGRGVILSAWLLRATRFTCTNVLVSQYRRVRREQQAVQMQNTTPDEPSWEQIAPLLDAAMASLGEKDRNAVALRFFDQKSLEEVGVALGVDTGAAQKRVWRAVEKLRQYFSRHGASFSAAAITTSLSGNVLHSVPTGLAAKVAATAALKGTAASSSTATLLKTTLKLMAWTKAKIAVLAGVGLLLAAGTTVVAVKEIQEHTDAAYSWEDDRFSMPALDKFPPSVMIVPTKFPQTSTWLSMASGKMWGIGASLQDILCQIHGTTETRSIFSTPLPRGRFDYIACLPSGSEAALQKEIEKKFDITEQVETIETNVFLLQVKDPTPQGLKPTRVSWSGFSSMQNEENGTNQTIASLALHLENKARTPIIDKTGLAGGYDFDLRWDQYVTQQPGKEPDRENELAALKRALEEQLGLELVPGTAPVEMLVVDKKK